MGATAEAIKSIVQAAKQDDRKLSRVALMVSVKGIKMSDLETGKTTFDFSIYRISYCSADATFTHVFAFIAVNLNESLECHAFLGRKQKIAQAATLSIAKAFNLAFDRWKEKSEEEKLNAEKCEVCKCCCRLKDNSDSSDNKASSSIKDETEDDNGILKLENAGIREGSEYSFPCEDGDLSL